MSSRPIGDYALLSDCRSAALVSSAGSIDWLCMPRFDAPSVFGRLLDERAGHWSIRPRGEFASSRRYLDGTLVVETTYRTSTGAVKLVDGLALGHEQREHALGKDSPHVLLRSVTCVEGEVSLELEWAPRPEYGLVTPSLQQVERGVVGRWDGGRLSFSSSIPLRPHGSGVMASFHLRRGEGAAFALAYHGPEAADVQLWSREEIEQRLVDTAQGWESWSALHQSYDGRWQAEVRRSGLILRALTFEPSGAIVAAVTTSLPEAVGGSRNWDYRFTWVRDACLTLDALWVAACPHEADRYLDFLAEAAEEKLAAGKDLQVVFGVRGEEDLTERELGHLRGWRGSAPVRIGNRAWQQRQIDVYGELLGAVYRLAHHLEGLGHETRHFLVAAADAAAKRWTEKDRGIWEVRGEPRHFLYSKLMCWVALDRAIRLAGLLEAQDRVEPWSRTRDDIRHAILKLGWSERAQSFARCFGSDDLDASSLMLPIVGFLPATDPRVRSTIRAIAERLTDAHGLVYRYRAPDGLAGEEGSFLLCTFWLAQTQAMAGDLDEAIATFERAAGMMNDVGLLSEEVDSGTGELLGNYPQAFSHIGLINAAWTISQATAGEAILSPVQVLPVM